MFNISGPELLVILVVALIVLGPNRLPQAAKSIGNAMREFRKVSGGIQDEIKGAIDEVTGPIPKAEPPAKPNAAYRPHDADKTDTRQKMAEAKRAEAESSEVTKPAEESQTPDEATESTSD